MKINFNNMGVQAVIAAAIILALHWISDYIERGWVSWAMALPALGIIFVTALARVKDITATGKRWFVRRLGFLLVAGSSLVLAAAPVMGYAGSFPSWRAVFLFWGFALVWLTTPNMPPWWKYINGDWKLPKGQQA